MNLYRYACLIKQNFSKNSTNTCNCRDCLEKNFSFSNKITALKFQITTMIDEMIILIKEISCQKSCLGILARGEWLASVCKRLKPVATFTTYDL